MGKIAISGSVDRAKILAAFKAGDLKLALTGGPANDLAGFPFGSSGDLRVREVV